MSKVIVQSFTISIDGYGAGPNQSDTHPLGAGGERLHQWLFPTRTLQTALFGKDGTTGVDDEIASRGFKNIGAWIMGSNMFGPPLRSDIPGDGPNPDWKGWWGDNPPYHAPVYVLTHHTRDPIQMDGGTTFYFVTDGMQSALNQAKSAAKDQDVRIVGGAATIREYLKAGLIDEMHIAISPIILGSGEHLLCDVDLLKLGYACEEHVTTEKAMHVVFRKQ